MIARCVHQSPTPGQTVALKENVMLARAILIIVLSSLLLAACVDSERLRSDFQERSANVQRG